MTDYTPSVIVVDNGDSAVTVDVADVVTTIDVVRVGVETITVITGGTGTGGGGSGDISSGGGDGPTIHTIASYTGDGFAALPGSKDAHTLYVVSPVGAGQGSMYLGNTLITGTLLSTPTKPTSPSAVAGDTQVTLNWSTPGALGGLALVSYSVQRSTTSGSGFTTIATVSSSTHTYLATGLTNGTPYYFKVFATNSMGNSASSDEVSATPVTTSTTVLATSDASSEVGDLVTFTATVASAGAPAVAGSVTFKRGAGTLGGAAVNPTTGIATFTTAAIPIGSWPIVAEFDGGGAYLPSTSNTVTQTVIYAGGPAPITNILTSDDASAFTGQIVTFTATITRTATGLPVNSGTVTFRDATTTLAVLPVNTTTGLATYTTSALTLGTHPITAEYTGAPFYDSGTSNTVSQVVSTPTGASGVAQAIYLAKPVARLHELVTFRTTITSGGAVVTTGSVVWKDGATTLGTGIALNLYGESTFTTWTLGLGTHTITAEYTGEPTFENDVSTPITIDVVAELATPTEPTWDGAFHSGSLATCTEWFHFNTGFLAEGFDFADLWNPTGVDDDVIITTSWLTAHAGANVVNTGGANWTITGLRTGHLRIQVPNLTFNHCWFHRLDYAHVFGGAVNVWATDGTDTPTTVGNLRFNYCTLSTDGTASEDSYGGFFAFDATSAVHDNVIWSHCEGTMWPIGFQSYRGVSVQYCWVHDLSLFGFDPHNTSASIRDRECHFTRNLFCDGTSSDVSLYADFTPYTDWSLRENMIWVIVPHASPEINFPLRSTGYSPLLPGYFRELTDNKLQRGAAGDLNYFSKVSGNTLITGEALFGGADTVQIAGVPTELAGPFHPGGADPELISYHYTPSPSSTLFLNLAVGRAGNVRDPAVAITDESGASWFEWTGALTDVETAPAGLAQYGVWADIWRMETSPSAPAFRRLIIDPYSGFTSSAYMAANVIEVSGVTGITAAQPAVHSGAGHASGFGETLESLTSGTLASNATSGNLVFCFVAWSRDAGGGNGITAPAGWNVLGNNWQGRMGAATLWRTDFTGRSVTIPDMDHASTAVTVLVELVL